MSSETDSAASEQSPTFDILPLSDEVRRALADLGYTHPTPVQREVFASAIAGRDLVVQARTGTGKTTAFGLPIVDRLVDRAKRRTQALALCPTRELALQVTRELEALGKHAEIDVLPVYGGTPMPKQIAGLEAGAQILVGTPGRVLDHLRRGSLNPEHISVLALDECDEMLSMGFLPQIMDIWGQLPKQLQVLLFSATVPRAVKRVADSHLRDPQFVTLSGDSVGALEIDHYMYISRGDKPRELLSILKSENPESAIIFCNTRDDTQRVASTLKRAGYKADWLNADLSQSERESVMKATREERLPFLVCTDVAARGIDISHLTHVINFDFPESTEQYVHRTGRTGRAGRTGTAISLVSPGSIGNLYYLRLEYKIHPIERQLPTEEELQARADSDTIAALAARFGEPSASERSLVRRMLTHDRADSIIAGALRLALQTATQPQASEATPSKGPEQTAAKTQASGRRPKGETGSPSGDAQVQRSAPSRKRGLRDDRGEAPASELESESHIEDGIRYEVRPAAGPSTRQSSRAPRAAADDSSGRASTDDAGWEGPVDEIFVNVGREDQARTSDLRRALELAGVSADDTAYIRIRQRHSFVGVRQGLLEKAVMGLTGQNVAGRDIAAEPARGNSRDRAPRRRDMAASN